MRVKQGQGGSHLEVYDRDTIPFRKPHADFRGIACCVLHPAEYGKELFCAHEYRDNVVITRFYAKFLEEGWHMDGPDTALSVGT